MSDGLICEFSAVDKECRLVMFDPVSTTTRALPTVNVSTSPRSCYLPPAIVMVVHNSNFKSRGSTYGFFLYESSTDAWRDLRSPLDELAFSGMRRGRVVHSAVYFQGTFYATFGNDDRVLLGSYNLDENSWKEVFTVASEHPGFPQLIVYKTRMFMPVWLDGEAHGALLRTGIRGGGGRPIFEIREIMEDSSSKSVVKIPLLEIQRVFYGEEDVKGFKLDIGCAFPINSHSVMLFSRFSGKSIVYNVMSGCAAELPAHPLSQASCEFAKEKDLLIQFSAKLMNLSVRDILASSPTPVACTR